MIKTITKKGGFLTLIIGYARVSTKGQEKHGNSLEEQERVLKDNGCSIVHKESYSGAKMERPVFNKLLGELKLGDTLVVTKLDRFARSTIQGCTIVQGLIEKGIRVNILNMGILDNTPASTLMRTIFFAFAQFEREMIIERTQEGKAVARTKGDFHEGRPLKFTDTQLDMALGLLEKNSYRQVEKMTKISISTLVRAKRKISKEGVYAKTTI